MNVKTLKNLLEDLPDDAQVIVWVAFDDEEDREALDVEEGHISSPEQTPAVHLSVRIKMPG